MYYRTHQTQGVPHAQRWSPAAAGFSSFHHPASAEPSCYFLSYKSLFFSGIMIAVLLACQAVHTAAQVVLSVLLSVLCSPFAHSIIVTETDQKILSMQQLSNVCVLGSLTFPSSLPWIRPSWSGPSIVSGRGFGRKVCCVCWGFPCGASYRWRV